MDSEEFYDKKEKNIFLPIWIWIKKRQDIFLLALACIYIISPYDVIPEAYLGGIWPYSDDILVFILACVKSYGMGKRSV